MWPHLAAPPPLEAVLVLKEYPLMSVPNNSGGLAFEYDLTRPALRCRNYCWWLHSSTKAIGKIVDSRVADLE